MFITFSIYFIKCSVYFPYLYISYILHIYIFHRMFIYFIPVMGERETHKNNPIHNILSSK